MNCLLASIFRGKYFIKVKAVHNLARLKGLIQIFRKLKIIISMKMTTLAANFLTEILLKLHQSIHMRTVKYFHRDILNGD